MRLTTGLDVPDSALSAGRRAPRARAKTASSIGSVSLPVKVFCWLTWNEHEQRAAVGRSGTSTPWPNVGRGAHAEHRAHATS